MALRFVEAARGVALPASEDMAGAETLEVDVPAGVGGAGLGLDRLVSRLFGDGISAKVKCSRAPLKLGKGFCSTSVAFFRERTIRNELSVVASNKQDGTKLSKGS